MNKVFNPQFKVLNTSLHYYKDFLIAIFQRQIIRAPIIISTPMQYKGILTHTWGSTWYLRNRNAIKKFWAKSTLESNGRDCPRLNLFRALSCCISHIKCPINLVHVHVIKLVHVWISKYILREYESLVVVNHKIIQNNSGRYQNNFDYKIHISDYRY
jgi:hypothetical protein